MRRVNPATGEKLDSIDEHTDEDVDAALSRATQAFEEWSTVPMTKREQSIEQVGEVLRTNTDEYAELMTKEMGKPIDAAVSEVEKCAWVCEYYAENAGKHLADERFETEAEAKAFVSYEPMGPIFAIMPWNFPLWQVFRFAAPNITAGNVGLLKHAGNVPGCARAIEEIFHDAGYPEGVFQALLVGSDAAQDAIEDERIAAVTITGSEGAGRAVAETAGSEIKKTVLELGGSDPFVVLSDADLDAAAEVGAQARLQNNGESCIAAKRFIVEDSVYDEFLDRFIAEMESYEVGNPMDENTDIGPQAREDLMEDLHDQVERTVEAGATVELGGEPLDRDGFYYPPTVLTDVPRDSAAGTEEVFGPAAPVFRVAGEEEALELANDIHYGLGASVWTEDLERGERVAREFEAGCCFVNELVKSDPRIPFGGIKNSGYGRELSRHGIREFTNKKTVWVQSASAESPMPTNE